MKLDLKYDVCGQLVEKTMATSKEEISKLDSFLSHRIKCLNEMVRIGGFQHEVADLT